MERMRQAQDQVPAIGIDFGTTNSTVARASGKGQVELVAFPTNAGETFSFRSVLYLQQVKHGARKKHMPGPARLRSNTTWPLRTRAGSFSRSNPISPIARSRERRYSAAITRSRI